MSSRQNSIYKSEVRGIFHHDEDPQYWKEAVATFPNRIPRYTCTKDAMDWVKRICERGSNPDEPHLYHNFTTLTDWTQIEKYLLPKIQEYRARWNNDPDPVKVHPSDSMTEDMIDDTSYQQSIEYLEKNIYLSSSSNDELAHTVYEQMISRLELPIHQTMSSISTMNTLLYLFHHMRCGIYVMIRNNEPVIFCPFVNKNYTNTWSDVLELDSPDNKVETYFQNKSKYTRPENYIDKKEWWANGNIICNEHTKINEPKELTQWWGDHFLFQLKDMIAETCNNRYVPNCEFFINKRDYPQLKYNAQMNRVVEPYGFIFNRDDRYEDQDVDLSRHLYKSYVPILSFYTSSRFGDIPIPPSEDWEAATGQVFATGFRHNRKDDGTLEVDTPRDLFTESNLKKFERPWEEKVSTAFFRGTATGGGVTVETNQRLHAAYISHNWSLDEKSNGRIDGVPYLDAKITGWNLRDKKISSGKMTFLRKSSFPFTGDKSNFIPIYEQSKYKYVLYIEGHCAACRYGFMMQLGCVIFKVESRCVADQMWYFPLLKPYYDHIPIKNDFSDLQEKIEWCRSHDSECQVIANNAKALYHRYISRDGILDYMQSIFIEMSKRTIRDPVWAPSFPNPKPVPSFPSHERYCTQDGRELCSTCKLMKEEEDKIRAAQRQIDKDPNSKIDIEEKKRRFKSRIQGKLAEKRQKRENQMAGTET